MAPLSFMSVDKAKYTKGVLTIYELGRHDLSVAVARLQI